MEVLEGEKDVCSIELCCVLLEAPNLTEVEEEFATWAVLEAEVELALCLERVVHLHDKLVIDALLKGHKKTTWSDVCGVSYTKSSVCRQFTYQNSPLIESVFKLIASEDLTLFQDFERVHLLRVFLFH